MTAQTSQPEEAPGRESRRSGPPVLVVAAVGFLLAVAIAVVPSWLRTGRSNQARATVTVHSEPTGARAYLDGELLGSTPARRQGVTFGAHELLVRKALFVTRRLPILVDKAEYAVSVTLQESPTSSLSVQSTPPAAKVFVDGAYRGNTPLTLRGLRPGSRHVRVQMGDRETWQDSVLLEPHKTASVQAALRSLVEDRSQRRIEADPTDIHARVDLALVWLAQRKYDDASEALVKAWKLAQSRPWMDPAYVHLRTEVARAYRGEIGELSAALPEVRTHLSHAMSCALATQPSNVELIAFTCDLFACDPADTAGLEVFEALVKQSPSHSRMATALSRLHVAKGSPEKAIPILEAILPRQRTNWQLLRQLAQAYHAAGRSREARNALRKSLLHCDREAPRRQIREDLAKMHE